MTIISDEDKPLPTGVTHQLRVARESDDPDWRSKLLVKMKDDGTAIVKECVHNTILLMANDKGWAGTLAYNEFADKIVLLKDPPYKRPRKGEWSDIDDSLAAAWFEQKMGWKANHENVRRAVAVSANMRAYHPVRTYLESLTWDGVERLPTWLDDIYGCGQNEYTSAVGTAWMVGGAKRILSPGGQLDLVLILEGPQGIGKSTSLQALMPDSAWFADTLPDIRNIRQAGEYLQGSWLIEMGELAVLSRSEVDVMKAFVTRLEDKYLPPYGKRSVIRPRQCFFAGTVNPGASVSGYLRDETGGRRWFPIECTYANRDLVKSVREQLWAEAVVRVKRGEQPYIPNNTIASDMARQVQESRGNYDSLTEVVIPWLDQRVEEDVTTTEILEKALNLEVGKHDVLTQRRIASIVVQHGWKKSENVIRGGKRYRGYKKHMGL